MKTFVVRHLGSGNLERLGAARPFGRQAIATLAVVVGGLTVGAQDATQFGKGVPLPEIPEAKSPFTLLAVNDPGTGKSSFSYGGKEVAPVIRAMPGTPIRIEYVILLNLRKHAETPPAASELALEQENAYVCDKSLELCWRITIQQPNITF